MTIERSQTYSYIKKSIVLITLGFALLLLSVFVISEGQNAKRPAKKAAVLLSQEFDKWKNEVSLLFEESTKVKLAFSSKRNFLISISEAGFSSAKNAEEGYLVFQGDSLAFWSSNALFIPQDQQVGDGISKIGSSWYFITKHEIGPQRTVVNYKLLYKKYGIENEYIKGGPATSFPYLNGIKFSDVREKGAELIDLKTANTDPVFLAMEEPRAVELSLFRISCEILGILLALFGLLYLARSGINWFLWLALIGAILFRLLLLQGVVIPNLSETQLFQPEIFAASDWAPSLGDLLLHFVFGVFVVSILLRSKILRSSRSLISLTIALITFCFSSELIRLMLWDSNIPLEFNNLAALNEYSIVALAMITSLLLLGRILMESSLRNEISKSDKLVSLTAFLVFTAIVYFSFDYHWSSFLFPPLVFLLSLKFTHLKKNYQFSIFRFFPEIFLFSTLFALHSNDKTSSYDEIKINQILSRESQETDPIAEYYLKQTERKFLQENVGGQDVAHIRKFFRTQSYPKYLHRFELGVEVDSVNIADLDEEVQPGDFVDYKKVKGNLFRKMSEGNMSYFLIFQLDSVEVKASYVARDIPDGEGLPSLLTSGKISKFELTKNYSLAKYRDNKLLSNQGDFSFPSSLDKFVPIDINSIASSKAERATNFSKEDFVHYLVQEHGNVYVLSQVKESGTSLVNFSYVFFALTIFMFVALLLWRWIITKKIFPEDFKSRLQYALLFVLFFSTTITAIGSIYLLKEQHSNENSEAISEKVKSIVAILESDAKSSQKVDLKHVGELASTFFSDIILYRPSGELMVSSQPSIFHEGILSRLIDAEAYWRIMEQSKVLHVQVEEIHGMSYLSAYAPLHTRDGEIYAILNLPYFAKTDEFENEINDFLFALINIYLFLTGLSVVLALFTSNRMVQPLKLIEQKISQISLTGKPENIYWKNNDEIGALVNSYNKMVNELSESAQKLAAAEREGAWKEMAQQVAHEIKNPLTPMKLNIQHFQMKWSGLSLEEKEAEGKRLSKLLMEQIDTLSAIASDFSNFSKISDPKIEDIKIVSLLESAVSLFEYSEGVAVKLVSQVPSDMLIKADSDQTSRIFNNVIKNAVQATEGMEGARVDVHISSTETGVCVSIADNGMGISDQEAPLIFQPKFTTKTSGMGLGLAMVKSMIEAAGGSITFESKQGEGTIFYLTYPLSKNS